MRDPRRAQQMQGLGGLLAETGIPAVVERLSYGEPLTTGRGMTTRLRPEAEAALMTLGPEAVPIGRGAMAAVRATKGLPVGAATVYHGSPYRFQRFDPTKIGSGKGAQAYGYGHYVAESPDVASTYASMRSPMPRIYKDEKPFEAKTHAEMLAESRALGAGSIDEAIARQTSKLQGSKKNEQGVVLLEETGRSIEEEGRILDALRTLKAEGYQPGAGGHLYTVDLPDPAIARMLDWDKKFSEQPENVQRGILKYWSENPGLKYYGRPEQMTGEGIYGSVKAASLGPEGGARINLNPANQAAAMDLRYQGIPGIRYLEQGSRGAGKGTSNFVVFPGEEDLLRILSVNGGLLGP